MHHPLSPSKFPAWAQCPAFESDPAGGDAAAEGTRQHELLASLLRGDCLDDDLLSAVSPDGRDNVAWAVEQVRQIKACYPDAELRVETQVTRLAELGGEPLYFGTADAIIGDQLIDYKSGDDSRDYTAQMAGYALALFDENWTAETVTAHVLYGRARRAKVHTFTLVEAEAIVAPILAARLAPDRVPVPCDWCCYCASSATCPALVERAGAVALARDWRDALPAIAHPSTITDPALWAQALALARHVGEWVDSVKHHAAEFAKGGGVIPGYKLQERKGARDVSDIQAAFARSGLTPEQFLPACKLSLTKLAEAYAAAHGTKKAEAGRAIESALGDIITEGKPSVSLVRIKGEV